MTDPRTISIQMNRLESEAYQVAQPMRFIGDGEGSEVMLLVLFKARPSAS